MTDKAFSPVDIQAQNENGVVVVKWGDGHASRFPIRHLRGYCPCAVCQGHSQGGLKWIDNKVVTIFDAQLVGRYAVNFKFGDAHDTGIYRWELLRKLDPDEQQRWGAPEAIGRV